MAQVQDVCKSLQSVPSTENDAEDSGKTSATAIQDDATEVLRNMQFTNMSGCTYNFTLR